MKHFGFEKGDVREILLKRKPKTKKVTGKNEEKLRKNKNNVSQKGLMKKKRTAQMDFRKEDTRQTKITTIIKIEERTFGGRRKNSKIT